MITLETLMHWLSIPRENEHIDFKEAKQQFDFPKLLGYCVAFANERGGHLVLGVSDKLPRKVVGTNAIQNTGEIKSKILEKLKIRVEIHELNHPDGRVVVVEIPSRPNGHPMELNGTYYMRSGEQLVPMPANQLRKIFSEGVSWEGAVAEDYTIDDLDHEEIMRAVNDAIFVKRIPPSAARDGIENILKKFNLLVGQKPKRAAVALFAKHIHSGFMQCWLKMARFRGTEKSSNFIDNQQIRCNIFQMLDEADNFFRKHLPVSSHLVDNQFQRVDRLPVPSKALREALVNAVCHRDYQDRSGYISIAIFDDHIEVWNNGTLPDELTLKDLKKKHPSILRNELIAQVFYFREFIESWGNGIKTMMESCKAQGAPVPQFSKQAHGICVTFKFAEKIGATSIKKDTPLSTRQREIVSLLQVSLLNSSEIAKKLSGKPALRTVQLELGKLEKLGYIKKEGETRATKWKLVE